ncbi:fatty acid desaturase [Catellatospora sp. KI3]|uniref:fatty acid desaturase family protein n=1 Tax=Catellatospora sp. KI3 TaxID=3041620 RepID=UPI0024827C5D|nr:fatty acid desaturase [Catellatospora sp. KI3]MDI1466072.1 fatty acid desaturase [Catellatospora sp. KI3]
MSTTTATEDPVFDEPARVLLAPVRGADIRRDLPEQLFVKRPLLFTVKFLVPVAVIAACWAAVAIRPAWWTIAITVPVLGLMYAHLVELQHECLHEHAYPQRWLNRLVGYLCGVPMMSSYWHYKYEHLRHHAYLGTPQNQEFFNYRFEGLGSVPGFIAACYHLGRYLDVFRDIGRSLIGRTNPRVTKPLAAKKIRTEYLGIGAALAAAIVFTVLTRDAYLLWVWVLPALLVAEPAHFLVELPEHFGLNTQSDPNVLSNTRTVYAGWFAKWYTNGNDLHTAHHFHQGVPMAQVPGLHRLIEQRIENTEPSYWSFYSGVMRGRIVYQGEDATCMTR